MEPFTVIVWIWMGQRFEETRMEGLDRGECVERTVAIEADRASDKAKAQCVGPKGYVFPRIETSPACAHATWCMRSLSLPGRV